MSRREGIAAAALERLRALESSSGRLEAIEARLAGIEARLERIEPRLERIEPRLDRLGAIDAAVAEIRGAVRAIAAQETDNRRRLEALRSDPDYPAAWSEARPLVTVTVAATDRAELLLARSLPSILTQSHSELELIVVGEKADAGTAAAMRELYDPRVVFRTLTRRPRLSDDLHRQRLVTLTLARNEAIRLARGRWIVCFDEDAQMRPDFIARLLERAREDRLEAVYGRALAPAPGGAAGRELGSLFPPQPDDFHWTAAIYHAGLSFLGRELFAADLGLSGDWYLAERMLRAGVRFGALDAVVCETGPAGTED